MVLFAVPDPNLAVPTVPVLIASPVIELVESSVLFDKLSVVARATKVSVAVGKVRVPVFEIDEMTGEVRVLLVSVSVVARPTRVSVAVGRVSVPVLDIDEMTGVVRVLFVRVCVPVSVTTVESIEMVPVEVSGPPVNPVPVLT